MTRQKLIDEVGKYIDKYYEPVKDDIKMDKEMKSIFDRITRFRKKSAEKKALQDQQILENSQTEESVPEEFDVSTMQKTKLKKGMSSTMSVNRNIDNLMNMHHFQNQVMQRIHWQICIITRFRTTRIGYPRCHRRLELITVLKNIWRSIATSGKTRIVLRNLKSLA